MWNNLRFDITAIRMKFKLNKVIARKFAYTKFLVMEGTKSK